MKKYFCLLFLFSFLWSCQDSVKVSKEKTAKTSQKTDSLPTYQKGNFAIVIHGGAGNIDRSKMPDSLQKAYEDKLKEAIQTGHQILADGGTAVEAVQLTINVMENSSLFNSGKGAVFTHDEKNSLDASIMDGKTLNAGAVA